ncbi:unnamed protein product [Rotaria socialis]
MISNSLYEYIDKESIGSDLICLLCHNPFIDPTVTQCGDTYCRQCIEKYMRNGSHCPSQSCNQLLSTDHLIPPSHNFISILDKLKVRCQLCEKTNINRGTFDEHIKTSCPECILDCPGKNIGCQWFGSRNEHDEHTKTCLYEKLRRMGDILGTFDEHIKTSCPECILDCPGKNIGCQWFGSRNEHDEHTKTCLFEKLGRMVDILYKVIENQSLDIEKLQKETQQQTTEIGQQKTEIEQQKAQLQQQQIQISDIQSENQTQKNGTASVCKQITILQEEINKLKSTALWFFNIPDNAKWAQNGVTIAGGHGEGSATNQLSGPCGLFVDDDQTVVIADRWNHRIMQWKNGDTTNGQAVAGDNGAGKGLHQLTFPTDVLIDNETDSLIICDRGNRRVVRWSRRSGTTQGELLIDNITCSGLAMDEQRYLYVSDEGKHDVRRYQLDEKNYTLVAGGNGQGDGLNQLNYPTYLFVDRQQNVYVSDHLNYRVMKWNKGAKEGIVVAGGQGKGNALTQLSDHQGIFVDTFGTLYVVDTWNHRVMRWTQGDKKQGTVIVGGNGQGGGANQFQYPIGLSFDRHGNLYVADELNSRVQRFSIE